MQINKRGFTIVEVLIVIVVIAILATITIVAYNGMQARATDANNLASANAITKAIEMYKINNAGAPPVCSGGNGTSCPIAAISSMFAPTYISQFPDDVSPAYRYVYVGTTDYDGAWSIRIYKRQTGAYCKVGVYPSALDTWWSAAPKC